VRPAEDADRIAETIARVRRLELASRRLVESLFAGQYHSAFKGRGLEFAEVREYDAADDHRLIDWNVTARTGVLHVRRYDEERELTTLLCVDVSGSQAFGTGDSLKRDVAANLCALVAFAALRNNDRVGALLFSDRVEHFLAPRKGRNHVLRMLRDVLFVEPESRATSVAQALTYVNQALRKRAVVFVASDFLSPGYEPELRVAALRHDVICAVLVDPWEEALPEGVGLVTVRDPESGGSQVLDTNSPRVVRRYNADRGGRGAAVVKRITACGADALVLRTETDIVPHLARFFRLRGLRRGGGRR
jgi:uncharacterized protein (DUF58 family)